MEKVIQVGKLSIDPGLVRLRPINAVFVGRYRQAYRSGKDLGQIVVDADNMVVVSGNHRVTAMLEEYGPKHEATVVFKKYKNRRELLQEFTQANLSHGIPLSGSSRRAITLELIKTGATSEEVAQLFGVAVNRVTEWAGMTVLVVGNQKMMKSNAKAETSPKPVSGGEYMPIKKGIEPGITMNQAQYNTHWAKDRGVSAYTQSEQIQRWLRNGWIKKEDDKTLKSLERLYDELGKFLGR
jgi:hypothetical protein